MYVDKFLVRHNALYSGNILKNRIETLCEIIHAEKYNSIRLFAMKNVFSKAVENHLES